MRKESASAEPRSRQEALALLEDMRNRITHRLKMHKRGLKADPEIAEFEEVAALELQRTNSSTLGSQASDTLAQITEAIARIMDGSYGECIDCMEHIGSARLAAVPHAARCLGCQEVVEMDTHHCRL